MHLTHDAAAVNLDSWGIKRLFSHCLRRWLAGSNRPRDACSYKFKYTCHVVLL